MFKKLDFRTIRALQICIIFGSTLAIQRWVLYSKAGWIGFAVMMIYAGFDPGNSINRTVHRFLGALVGLFLSYFLWIIGLLEYRLILFFIPIAVFFAYFLTAKAYMFPTIFTVTLSSLGTIYFAPPDYNEYSFMFDYFRSTVIAFCICIFFESVVFRKVSVTYKIYQDIEQRIVGQLDELLTLVSNRPLRYSHYLKLSTQCNESILELRAFMKTAHLDYQLKEYGFTELVEFNTRIAHTYQNIRRLFVMAPKINEELIQETKQHIHRLDIISRVRYQEGA